MSFNSWLQKFRSALAPGRGQRNHRRWGSLRAATHRPNLEVLEDRSVPALYAVTDLGTLSAADLNNAGQVVGQAATADGFNHAFLWDNGTMIDLGTLGGTNSGAYGINDLGQVVGAATLPEEASLHAFLVTPQGGVWFQDSDLDGRNDFMIDLGTLNGSTSTYAADINNAGQVVGTSDVHAFLWDAVNGMTDLGVPPGLTSSYANGINETGQVTVMAEYYDPLSGGSFNSAFLWDATNGMTALDGGPTYTDSQASAINDAGQVVGYWSNDSAQIDPALLWTPDSPNGLTGSFTNLGLLPGAIDSSAVAINNAGQVVGSGTVADEWGGYYPHAFLWDATGGMVDLQNQLLPGSDATLQQAEAINNGGAIIVYGYNGSGDGRSYLLTPIPTISIADAAAVTEGNAGTVAATFSVTLSAVSTEPVTVAYATGDDTASAGSDCQAQYGTLTFAPGETRKSITVLVNGDRLGEPNEAFVVNLSGNAAITDGQAVGTIIDDEPRISINDVTVTEGNTGTVNATFTVSLSVAYDVAVTVHYQTANGSATAGTDYAAASGDVTFGIGETTKTITVPVNGDVLNEADETFLVNLSGAANATIADGQGVGTVLNDDSVPALAISDVTVTEGNAGTVSATFTVSLSAASGQTVTVSYATADGTARAGSDYVAAAGSLTFAPGETSKTITVQVNGDRLGEANELGEAKENFFVNLSSPTNAIIADGQGVGTIVEDEPRISINDVTKAEGTNGQTTLFTFTVTLSAAYDQAVTMSFRTVNGTAKTSNGDYVAKTGTLTFAPGETTKTITIEVKGDSKREADETFYLDLFGNSSNSLFTKNRGIGTILNDD